MALEQRLNSAGTLLAGDIGATKITLAFFSPDQGPRRPSHQATFAVDDYPTLSDLLDEYFTNAELQAQAACFGVAGPVINRRVEMTNHNWQIDAAELERHFGVQHVWLLNDLRAAANAIPILQPQELETLQAGQPDAEGNLAVIAPGTGLGMGYLARTEDGYSVQAGEGGHSDFAPRDELQRELLAYLADKLGQVSVEDVCSGIGMPNIYHFLVDSGRASSPDWLTQKVEAADDPTPIIFEAAEAPDGPAICRQAVEVFVRVLGFESANLALKIGATGGLYLGGGIPPRILAALKSGQFMDAFLNKRLKRDYLERIPVHVVLNADAGLLGSAAYGLTGLAASKTEE